MACGCAAAVEAREMVAIMSSDMDSMGKADLAPSCLVHTSARYICRGTEAGPEMSVLAGQGSAVQLLARARQEGRMSSAQGCHSYGSAAVWAWA